MKKLSLLLGVLMIAGASYACDGNKKGCCKKETAKKECCKKDEKKACCKDKKECNKEAHNENTKTEKAPEKKA